jgi:hypothetical protein
MLKKAGIVVLGATAGMLSLAPLASAGEAPQRNDDHGHHQGHDHDGHGHGHGHGPRGGSCDGGADATLLNISDIGCDAEVGPINLGGDQANVDRDGRDGRGYDGDHRGHRHGDRDALINVSDILQNPTVNPVNALGNQANIDR